MPRKTRKHKERTNQKRQNTEQQISSPGLVKREFEFSLNSLKQKRRASILGKKNDNSHHSSYTGLVFKDLIKTVVLALILFSLELVLYFAWFK